MSNHCVFVTFDVVHFASLPTSWLSTSFICRHLRRRKNGKVEIDEKNDEVEVDEKHAENGNEKWRTSKEAKNDFEKAEKRGRRNRRKK